MATDNSIAQKMIEEMEKEFENLNPPIAFPFDVWTELTARNQQMIDFCKKYITKTAEEYERKLEFWNRMLSFMYKGMPTEEVLKSLEAEQMARNAELARNTDPKRAEKI